MAKGCYQNEGKLGVPYFCKAPIMGLYPTHKWFSRRTPGRKESTTSDTLSDPGCLCMSLQNPKIERKEASVFRVL